MRCNAILIREYDSYDYLAKYDTNDYDLIITAYPDSLTCFILKNMYSTKRGYATLDYLLNLDLSLENALKLTKCKNKIMENLKC